MKTFNETILVIAIAMLSGASMAMAQDATASPSPSASPTGSPGTATAESVVVTSQELDISREQIVPSLGATRYTVGPDRLDSQAQGENAPFNQTILRFPGSLRIPSVSCTSAANTRIYNIALTTCSCRKVFTGFGQELSDPSSPTIFR